MTDVGNALRLLSRRKPKNSSRKSSYMQMASSSGPSLSLSPYLKASAIAIRSLICRLG